jgi:hypothetical protein
MIVDGDRLKYMGVDPKKWAAEFCKSARDQGHDIDEEWMLGWFATAIMVGINAGTRAAQTAQKVLEQGHSYE